MSSNAIIDIKVVPLNIGSTAGTAKPTPVPINASASLNGGTRDYEKLNNKPSINGVELIGNKTSADLGIDKTYIHHQNRASSEWSINHNMDAYPSVSVVDSAGTKVFGDVIYTDSNNIICIFRHPFSGKAYLNA